MSPSDLVAVIDDGWWVVRSWSSALTASEWIWGLKYSPLASLDVDGGLSPSCRVVDMSMAVSTSSPLLLSSSAAAAAERMVMK